MLEYVKNKMSPDYAFASRVIALRDKHPTIAKVLFVASLIHSFMINHMFSYSLFGFGMRIIIALAVVGTCYKLGFIRDDP